MSAIRSFFNTISWPLLLSLGISPPLFPGSDGMVYAEFPHTEAPLSLSDWKDILIYLYTSGNEQTKKHAQQYKVVEVSRYTFSKATAHEVLVIKVELIPGTSKLLRIENDMGVRDVTAHNTVVAAPIVQDPELLPVPTDAEAAPASSTIAIHTTSQASVPLHNDSSQHPSISLYTHGTRPGIDEYPETGVATVQTIFEYSLRELSLVESCNSLDMYLLDFAILIAEVLEYDSHSRPLRAGHGCKSFTNLAMRTLDAIREETKLKDNGTVLTDGVPALETTSSQIQGVREVLSSYREAKEKVDAKRGIVNIRTMGEDDNTKPTVSHVEMSPGNAGSPTLAPPV